jgi:hypothetical protein
LISWATLFFLALAAALPKQYDVNKIIQRSVQANKVDWVAAPGYNYHERDRNADGSTETYDVTMILGSPYERLIAENDKALSPGQQADEERKLQETMQARRNESADQRRQRIADYEQSRRRDHLLLEQMTLAFDFKLIGEQQMGPYRAYVLKATRRSGYQPPNRECEVLTGMQGKLWIEEKTFQWVQVEAKVVQPVSIEGFLAKVEPGTQFELEKMPVAENVWLPKHFSMESQARIFFFFTSHRYSDETYFDYRPNGLQQAKPAH